MKSFLRLSTKIFVCWVFVWPLAVNSQTFYQDVAPIIYNNCSTCHRPGEAAPFSLLTYDDVAKRASFIKKVVESGYMPPWKADNSYVHFANDRTLSKEEVNTIVKWVDRGTPKGKNKGKEDMELFLSTAYTRQPDLTLMAKDTFLIKGDNRERFVVFKVPFELPDSVSIEAVEFFSNNKKLVHHVNYAIHEVGDPSIDIHKTAPFVNLTDEDRRRYDAYLPYKKKMSYYGGWIPGAGIESYPAGMGWVMPKRGVMLLTVHYSPTPVDEQSISGIHLFYAKKPVERKVKVISFGSGGIGEKEITPTFFMIPANKETSYRLTLSNPGQDFSLMYIWPHMHYIGKSFKAYATTQENDTIPLVNIPRWDFRWQELYRFKKFVRIPKGSKIHMECVYDNTAENPFNPFSPPQTIFSYGDMRSDQEMMTMLMLFLPYREGDEELSTL